MTSAGTGSPQRRRYPLVGVGAENLHVLGDALDLVALLDVAGLAHATNARSSWATAASCPTARALRLGEPCLPKSVAELRQNAELVVDLVGHLHVVLVSDGRGWSWCTRCRRSSCSLCTKHTLEVGLIDAKNTSAFALARLSARRAVRQRLGPAESAMPRSRRGGLRSPQHSALFP
jgi:hypothetical protein